MTRGNRSPCTYQRVHKANGSPRSVIGPSSLAPLELEPDDLPEVVLAAAADDAGLLLRGDGDGVAGRGALHRRGPHHVRVEQVLFGEWKVAGIGGVKIM